MAGSLITVLAGATALTGAEAVELSQGGVSVQTTTGAIAATLGLLTATTVSGTTAGSAVCVQPFGWTSYKKVISNLIGYNNTTGTAQTYTFPTAFTQTPVFIANTEPPATATTTTLTLPASMSGAITGLISLEGY